MKLNIVKPESFDFSTALGISMERATELATMMDAAFKGKRGTLIVVHEMFEEIVAACNTLEEVVWCTVCHTSFLAAKGLLLCPPQPKKINKNQNFN